MKILIAGLGGIGQRHVRNLRSLLGLEAEIIAYRTRKLDHVLTEQLEIETKSGIEEKYQLQTYDNLDEALARKPELAFICNPSSLHVPVALSAAQAGCHLFIEKPLSHNFDRVEELIDLVESKKLIALVGYQMRFHPGLRRLRSLLEQRAIGKIVAVRVAVGEFLPGFHAYEDYRELYASRSDLGGGVILSQIHELDYIYWLFGLPRRVFALGGHLSSLEIDVEDTASILMECSVDDRPVPVHVHEDYVQRPPTRTCEVVGDAGKILLDFHALTLQVFGDQGRLVEERSFAGFQRNQLFVDEHKHFMACLDGKEEPLVSLRDGAQSLRMALAAKESLATGKVVELK
jgi:predicted dehydrogenase